jgi:hypothetical protein
MEKIKLFTRFAALLVCASFFLLSSCGDDEKPKNQFKVNGKTYSLSHGYMDSDLTVSDEGSAHYVVLTGEDLELDEDGFMFGQDHFFVFVIGSTDADALAKGTYDIDLNFVGNIEFGEVPLIYAQTNLGFESDGDGGFNEVYDEAFYPYEGTVKVSKSGSKYTFSIKVSEFDYEDENGDEQEGDGGLRGYFSGSLEPTTIFMEQEELRVPAKVKHIFNMLRDKKGFSKQN